MINPVDFGHTNIMEVNFFRGNQLTGCVTRVLTITSDFMIST